VNEWKVKEINHGVQFKIKVQPRSSRNQIVGVQGDVLKIKLTAPPVDGEANDVCIKYIAHILNIPRSRVTIVTGITSHYKVIEIEGITKDDIINNFSI